MDAKLRVKRLSESARLPTRGSKLSAGYDLYAAHASKIPARGKGIVKTDIAATVPQGTYGRIAPRSGLAWKKHIDVGAGVIDRDYTGNIGVVLFNHGAEDLSIAVGDRVAQLILERIVTPEVEEVDCLDTTDRGAGGFGSTGVSLNAKKKKVNNQTAAKTAADPLGANLGTASKKLKTDDKVA